MTSDDPVHSGHRQRMRSRIIKGGLDSLEEHEVLEYLLYAYIPRKDTNALAHALISRFGGLAGVFNASREHLAEVAGMTDNAALFLSLMPDVFRAYLTGMNAPKQAVKGKGAARNFMGNMLYGLKEERAYVAALDAHDNLLGCEKIGSSGSGDSVDLSVRAVVDYALRMKASSVLLAHNHPSGSVLPSKADMDLTFQTLVTLAGVRVSLQDHFIFCDSECYSFEEDGKIERMRNAKTYLNEGVYFYD